MLFQNAEFSWPVYIYLLVACHALGDYVLQSDFLASTKGRNMWHLFMHCVLYTVPFALLVPSTRTWQLPVLLVSHFWIDILKARYKKLNYFSDQLSHFYALYFIYVLPKI